MRRSRTLLAVLLSLAIALAPTLGMARAGSGSSFGSRGTHTYSAPHATRTSPYGAAPMQRSISPRESPSYGYGGNGYGYRSHSPFMSGLLGGLIGAGIGGLLFGHGLFGGMHGFGGFFGLLIQLLLLYLLARWLFRRFFGSPAYASGGYARTGAPAGAPPGVLPMGAGGAPGGQPLQIAPSDYQAFEQVLQAVQAAWSAHDVNRLQQLCTPEMVGVLGEQMAEQASRGVRNIVSDVRLEQGDLAEAWSEGGRDYATVAMRFAMHDATRDTAGRIVDGSVTEWVSTTEYWTFVRARGGQWILSAIQQTR